MGHVQKLGDSDPDFRFMSLNDLLQLLNNAKPDFLHHDYNIAARTVDSIIKTLDDQNGEVQNLAIKWYVLGSLFVAWEPLTQRQPGSPRGQGPDTHYRSHDREAVQPEA